MSNEHLLTPSDLADRFQIPRLRIERMAKAGEIPAVFLPGNEIRFRESDVTRWLDGKQSTAPANSEVQE